MRYAFLCITITQKIIILIFYYNTRVHLYTDARRESEKTHMIMNSLSSLSHILTLNQLKLLLVINITITITYITNQHNNNNIRTKSRERKRERRVRIK